jgi:hypothetical protein
VGGKRHASASLPQGKTQYPMYRMMGGPVWTDAKDLDPNGIRLTRHLKIKIVLQRIIYCIIKENSSECRYRSTSTKTIPFEMTTTVTLLFCCFFLAAFHSQVQG